MVYINQFFHKSDTVFLVSMHPNEHEFHEELLYCGFRTQYFLAGQKFRIPATWSFTLPHLITLHSKHTLKLHSPLLHSGFNASAPNALPRSLQANASSRHRLSFSLNLENHSPHGWIRSTCPSCILPPVFSNACLTWERPKELLHAMRGKSWKAQQDSCKNLHLMQHELLAAHHQSFPPICPIHLIQGHVAWIFSSPRQPVLQWGQTQWIYLLWLG